MKFEKATYSRAALLECVDVVKKTAWTVASKRDHFSKCLEIQKIFDFCFEKTKCCLFEADYTCWKDYIKHVDSKGATKKELDADLRRCHTFIAGQLTSISTMMRVGEVNEIA